jgi:hypothetical protein
VPVCVRGRAWTQWWPPACPSSERVSRAGTSPRVTDSPPARLYVSPMRERLPMRPDGQSDKVSTRGPVGLRQRAGTRTDRLRRDLATRGERDRVTPDPQRECSSGVYCMRGFARPGFSCPGAKRCPLMPTAVCALPLYLPWPVLSGPALADIRTSLDYWQVSCLASGAVELQRPSRQMTTAAADQSRTLDVDHKAASPVFLLCHQSHATYLDHGNTQSTVLSARCDCLPSDLACPEKSRAHLGNNRGRTNESTKESRLSIPPPRMP